MAAAESEVAMESTSVMGSKVVRIWMVDKVHHPSNNPRLAECSPRWEGEVETMSNACPASEG
jgi:hypothetical protein